MKKEYRDLMNKALDIYNKKKSTEKAAKDAKEKAHAEFLKVFDKLVEDVIRPTLESFIDPIREKGHGCVLKFDNHVIYLNIFPNAPERKTSYERNHPSVGFVASRYSDDVKVYKSTFMPSGSGSFNDGVPLSDINEDYIVNTVVTVINKSFGGGGF